MELIGDTKNLNEFSKLHLKAYSEGSYYTLIHGDINYETLFREAPSLEAVYNLFINGIKPKDGTILKLPPDDIVGFYLINGHDTLGHEDSNFIAVNMLEIRYYL